MLGIVKSMNSVLSCEVTGQVTDFIYLMIFEFFRKFLEDISPFRGATDTPVLDFW